MVIRSARPEDAPRLVGVFEHWGHRQDAEAIAERLAAWAATPHAQVLIAEHDDAPVGVAAVSASPHLARPGRTARLPALAVDAAHRRRGAGAALVRAAEALARQWGCDRMEVTSSRSRAEAPSFYPALGYEEVSARSARFIRPL